MTELSSGAWSDADGSALIEAARAGDRLALMCALRDRVAARIADPKVGARDLAALTARLVSLVDAVDAVEALEVRDEYAAAPTRDEKFDDSKI